MEMGEWEEGQVGGERKHRIVTIEQKQSTKFPLPATAPVLSFPARTSHVGPSGITSNTTGAWPEPQALHSC